MTSYNPPLEFTIVYKDWLIRGVSDRPECRVLLPGGGDWCRAPSLRAAKGRITRDQRWVKVRSAD